MKKTRRKMRLWAQAAKSDKVSDTQELFSRFVSFEPGDLQAPRKRLYFPVRVFWMFLDQVLAGNISCSETLQKALAWLCFSSGTSASPSTSAYCSARKRLKRSWLERTAQQVAEKLEQTAPDEQLWHCRRVRIVDGSGLSMPDTPENQECFPQSKRQKKGCGFPTMRIVALFSLATGAMVRLAHGPLQVAERTLFHELWDWLKSGDVLLADRGFTSFGDFFLLKCKGVDSVMRNHQRRSTGQRQIKRLGRRDSLVQWSRTGKCPKWIPKSVWDAMPNVMTVRQIDLRVDIDGFRTEKILIVTTLLDPKAYPASDFTDLYRKRWLAEIFLRDIKISLGMDVLKCKSPEMIRKEVQMYNIAYNLIRAIMCEAASRHGVSVLGLSFKRTADMLGQWMPSISAASEDLEKLETLISTMLEYIAQLSVPHRPNRIEPRALKRRKKNYQLMTKPRAEFKEIPHRNHYRAA